MAFLDGNQPDRLCEPMKKYIESRGGEVRTNAPLESILTTEDGAIEVREAFDACGVLGRVMRLDSPHQQCEQI
eukprot:scaffold228591_cov32-Tisochrysis_lutea.AAC.3